MRIIYALIMIFVCLSIEGQTQTLDSLYLNKINAKVNSKGELFRDTGGLPGLEVPKGTGLHTIFTNTVWIGGKDQNGNLHLAAQTYVDQTGGDFSAGPVAESYPGQYDSNYKRVWKISQQEINAHKQNYNKQGYTMPEVIKNWPSRENSSMGIDHHPAPFVDKNGKGNYDPGQGDYPKIRGDKAIYLILNDARFPQHETNANKMDIEIQTMVYAYDTPSSSALHNTIFVNYKIKNHSSNSYHDVYLGNFTDFDIGYPFDDYVGCDTIRNLYFGYNGKNIDGDYGQLPPAMGASFLSTQLNSFLYYKNDFSVQGNPEEPMHYYNYLQGEWKDGTLMTTGSDGLGQGDPTRYLFPGDPTNPEEWSEESVGIKPSDRRGIGVAGPFSFDSEESLCLDMAFIYAQDSTMNDTLSRLKSVTKLKNRQEKIKQFYESKNFDCPEIETYPANFKDHQVKNSSVRIYPNPATKGIRFTFPFEIGDLKEISIYNAEGKQLKEFENPKNKLIRVSELRPGIYPVIIKTTKRVYHKKLIKQ